MLDSFFLRHAEKARVPAGSSLSVDRLQLAANITAELEAVPGIRIMRREIREIPGGDMPLVIASGPLTSPAFAQALSVLTMRKNLYFFDATCPLIRAESIDFSKLFAASRYEKGEADFLNIPLDREQYESFVGGAWSRPSRSRSGILKRKFFLTPACRWKRSPAAGRSRWPSGR